MSKGRTASKGRNPVLVLDKVDTILNFLEKVESAGPTEVSQAVGFNKSTTFRLLSALAHMGLVDRDEDTGRYRLGMRFLALGNIVEKRLDLRAHAQHYLQQLARETGQTAFLCVRQGFDALCLSRVPGLHVEVLELQPGGTLPLHLGAAGRVLLATLDDEEVEQYVTHVRLERRTEHTLHTAAQIKQDVETTRAQGYTVSREDVTPGICAIGAPIWVRGRAVGAVSIGGLKSCFTPGEIETLRREVDAAAAQIADRIRGSAEEKAG